MSFTPDELSAIQARRDPYGVECPACGAGPGLACVSGRGEAATVRAPHAARRRASARALLEVSNG